VTNSLAREISCSQQEGPSMHSRCLSFFPFKLGWGGEGIFFHFSLIFKYSKFNHCLKYSHGFWLVWTTYEPRGDIIIHIMKIEMWCLIIVLHWYCGVHTWTFNKSHLHIGHIIFWNMLWNVNHKALLNWMMLVQEVWDWLMQPLCSFNWF